MLSKKKYCLDTSGISNPLETMPENISLYKGIWVLVRKHIEDGSFAVTKEIYDELCSISPGETCECCKGNKDRLLLEVDQTDWDTAGYIKHITDMTDRHKGFISEYNGGIKRTIGVNDVSIVALAKTLKLPVISMEDDTFQTTQKRMRIPGLCRAEKVTHMTFNDFLKAEGS